MAARPNRSADNALLHALNAKDWPLVRTLLASPEAAALVAGKTRNGFTVLMAATMRCCPPDVTELILRQDLSAIVGERKWVRTRHADASGSRREDAVAWMASDFAESEGRAELAARIRDLEKEAPASHSKSKGGDARCALCSERVRTRPKICVLQDSAARGEEVNPLILSVLAIPEVVRVLGRVEMHRVTECHHFSKELTESIAVVQTLQALCAQCLDSDGSACTLDSSWHVIDLCSGRSLATALLTLITGCRVTAVDRLSADNLPHYAACGLHGVRYLQQDLMAREFPKAMAGLANSADDVTSVRETETLEPAVDVTDVTDCGADIERRARGCRRVAVLGVHCCGALSERAVEAYTAMRADVCVLMPCCLPPKATAPPLVYASRDQRDQYLAWAEWLRGHLAAVSTGAGAHADCAVTIHRDVLSPRNALVTAVRSCARSLHEDSSTASPKPHAPPPAVVGTAVCQTCEEP